MVRARLVGVVMVTLGLLSAQNAFAQNGAPERLDLSALNVTPALLSASAAPLPDGDQFRPIVPVRPKMGGKFLMNSLYASTAIMQGLDMHSTLKAFSAGAVEGNPLMAGVTKNRAAFVATKAAVAAATIFASKKLAKKNKVAAVITLVAVNSAYAMIVSNNYRLSRR